MKMVGKERNISSNLGFRHVQVLLLLLAMLLIYALRLNLSIAIVAMTDKDNENSFDWNIQTQSIVLSSVFWGAIILQIPGGELAARFGGSVLIIMSIGVNSLMSLLIPVAAKYFSWKGVCACRFMQGFSQGVTYPAVHNLIGKWVPLEDKSSLAAIIYAGGQLGTALQMMSSGFIADQWGWPAIFYVDGVIGVIWTIVYFIIGAPSPEASKLISDEERRYIQKSLGHTQEQTKVNTPWKDILTSVPFLALLVVHCTHAWGFWTLSTEIPSYLKQVLKVDIKSNGMISALPYLTMFLLSFFFGFMSDYVLRKRYVSVTTARKISNSIGHFGPALALIALSYSPADNVILAIVILTLVVGLNAGHLSGFLLVHIDMAPNYVSQLMGFTNFFANVVSILAPLAAGVLLKDDTDTSDWRKVFYLSSAIFIAGNLVFIMFGTSEKQKWNEKQTESTNPAQIQKMS